MTILIEGSRAVKSNSPPVRSLGATLSGISNHINGRRGRLITVRAIAIMLLLWNFKRKMAVNFEYTSCSNGSCGLEKTGDPEAAKAQDDEPGAVIVTNNVSIRTVQVKCDASQCDWKRRP